MAHPYWPLFDLQVETPRLTLRYIDDELTVELAALAVRGIHDPEYMPFSIPWTDQPSPQLERSALQFHWRGRAELSPDDWRIGFAVIVGGTVVGTTDIAARGFVTTRTVTTGSWLGREYQGAGLGKEFRLACLTLAFDGLDAVRANTAAWDDNHRSLGVTRALGYRDNGDAYESRRGVPARQLRFTMDRDAFDRIRRDDITISGLDATRELLGLGPG